MNTNVLTKVRAATPASAAPTTKTTTFSISPIQETWLVTSTNSDSFNEQIQKVVKVFAEEGFKLFDIKFSTSPIPEDDKKIARTEYCALLLFKGCSPGKYPFEEGCKCQT